MAVDKRRKPTDTRNWTRENLAWVAGIVEGEGCIGAWKSSDRTALRPTLVVTMTDADVIAKLHNILGTGTVTEQRRITTGGKTAWRWGIYSHERVQAVLAAIWPHLGLRRQTKAIAVLEGGK